MRYRTKDEYRKNHTEDLRTERQWNHAGFVVKSGERAVWLYANGFNRDQTPYFERKQVEESRTIKDEIKKKESNNALLNHIRKEEKVFTDEVNKVYTAWQLLKYFQRIPLSGAKCHMGDNGFFYYSLKDTFEISDQLFEKLKKLYTKKYGGWDVIDLEHTTYNGRIWWK